MFGYMDPVIQVVQGENVTLNCQVLLGNPPPRVQWVHEGRVITSDDHILAYDGTVIIDDIQVCHCQ